MLFKYCKLCHSQNCPWYYASTSAKNSSSSYLSKYKIRGIHIFDCFTCWYWVSHCCWYCCIALAMGARDIMLACCCGSHGFIRMPGNKPPSSPCEPGESRDPPAPCYWRLCLFITEISWQRLLLNTIDIQLYYLAVIAIVLLKE